MLPQARYETPKTSAKVAPTNASIEATLRAVSDIEAGGGEMEDTLKVLTSSSVLVVIG